MATAEMIAEQSTVRGTLMPVEEYLRTIFHPDRDYADGVAEERPVGEFEHSSLQGWLTALLWKQSAAWGIKVAVECRLQVRVDRYRIPDIMVLRAEEKVDRYPKTPPLICIEVVSPEDTWGRLRRVLDDYREMGVANIWIFDPKAREAWTFEESGFRKRAELTVEGTAIRVDVAEAFSVLD